MCHYYANPLSILLSEELESTLLPKELLEVVRCLPSFRTFIESNVKSGDVKRVRSLLDDDSYLIERLQEERSRSEQWVSGVLRNVKVLTALQNEEVDFIQTYLDVMANGSFDMPNDRKEFVDAVQRMPPDEAISFLSRVLSIIQVGDASIGLESSGEEHEEAAVAIENILTEITKLQKKADEDGTKIKSKYSGHNKVLRTTVIAQKVQLSRDTADLSEEDNAYTGLIDRMVQHLSSILKLPPRLEDVFLHEVWLCDIKTPYKDVFIPRPRATVERALSRPHDYLSCSCCKSGEEGIKPTLPATAILYHMYRETGALINVADLWSAFYTTVGEDNDGGLDERTALVLFYRAISELKAMGFVKQSRKKADHVAKLAWEGL